MVTATWSRRRRKITAAHSGLSSVAPSWLAEASANQEDPRRPGHAGWLTRRDVAGTTGHVPPSMLNVDFDVPVPEL